MTKVILLLILFNLQSGEIEKVQVKGFEDVSACEKERKEFVKHATEAGVAGSIYLRCVSPTEQTT